MMTTRDDNIKKYESNSRNQIKSNHSNELLELKKENSNSKTIGRKDKYILLRFFPSLNKKYSLSKKKNCPTKKKQKIFQHK